jgi:hypothetical protein
MLFAVLVGIVALLVTVVIQGAAAFLAVQFVQAAIHRGYSGPGRFRNVLIMQVMMTLMLVGHLCQIGVWSLPYVLSGELRDYHEAFYFSAASYTTLGTNDVTLSGDWRLLGPLEATNGVLMFGHSTAVMFAGLSRLREIQMKK